MSIVEMPTIADIFYNPHGGILVYLLKGVINMKKQKEDYKKSRRYCGTFSKKHTGHREQNRGENTGYRQRQTADSAL